MLGRSRLRAAMAPILGESPRERKQGRHPLRPFADRLSPHRRRPHRLVQLALCAPPWRQVPAAHRGHRQGPLHPGGDRRDPRRHDVARPRVGRRDLVPVAIRPASRRGRARAARARPRLSLLDDPGGAGRGARGGAARTPAVPHRRSPWRDRDDGPADPPFVVRLKAPRDGETAIDDQVQGRVTVQNARSTISCCCAPTARRPTCSPWWSTIMTWA